MADNMDLALRNLIYANRCVLQGVPVEREMEDLDSLYELAGKHSILALTACAFPDDERFTQAKNRATVRYFRYDYERSVITKALTDAGIWNMLLKGSVLNQFYPSPELREMSDIDIFYDKRYDVEPILTAMGYKAMKHDNGTERMFFKDNYYNVEMHYALFCENHRSAFYEYYADVEKRLIGDIEKHFSKEDFYIYLIAHAAKHYMDMGGTGLRTLIDTYVYCSQNDLDLAYIEDECKKLGIEEYEKINRSLSMKLYKSGEELTEEEEQMLKYIAGSGTYGTPSQRVQHKMEKSGSKGRYILGRIFINRQQCKFLHPFFYRYPIFLPAFWGFRIIRAVFLNRKKIKIELKTVFKGR